MRVFTRLAVLGLVPRSRRLRHDGELGHPDAGHRRDVLTAVAPIDILGIAAGAGTTGSLVPQIGRIVRKTRSAAGLSTTFLLIRGISAGLWLVYGIRFGQAFAFQYAQALAVPLVLVLIALTVRFGRCPMGAGIASGATALAVPAVVASVALPTALVGWIATALSAVTLVPQARRVWSAPSSPDLSWAFVTVFATGVVLWTIYGLVVGLPSVWITQLVIMPVLVLIVFLRLRARLLCPDRSRGNAGTPRRCRT
jgi:MtN3 and saliva related transmembrane protein